MFRVKAVLVILAAFTLLFMLVACNAQAEDASISGIVLDANGPVAGAIVRVQTTKISTITESDGSFVLNELPESKTFAITAWADGYFISGFEAVPPHTTNLTFTLHAHAEEDNPGYEWVPSTFHPGQGEDQGCAECHASPTLPEEEGVGVRTDSLPVDEWLLDAHSQSATNPRFLTMYLGQDLAGNQSPPTRYGTSRDYGTFPLRPDPNKPYYGPGYKLDFPGTAGNCAACHTPAAAIDNAYGVDPTTVSGVPAEGVPCDFCHKVWDVKLGSATNQPLPNMPGVLSFEFRRPPKDHQFFAGPLDDIGRVSPSHDYTSFCGVCHFKLQQEMWPYDTEDLYAPVQQSSQFCAPCHSTGFWDTQIYNSYGEWLESDYSNPESGQTCQDCHMPSLGATQFALTEKGGLQRPAESIFSHRMPGASDEELLQNAVSMEVAAAIQADQIIVDVTITNDKTGHHVPTDSPLRHMILLVDVTDPKGNLLPQVDGPTVPLWGGVGDPQDELALSAAEGYYAGRPGTAYAKILQEMWTEVSPTGAYWNPTRILSDNRIPALGSDTTTYVFDIPDDFATQSEISVDVKLFFRRAFIELMDQKGWDDVDILMAEASKTFP